VSRSLTVCFFWLPLAASAYFAFAPDPPSVTSGFDDRILHGFTFSYLTASLCFSYYRSAPIWPALSWLAAYGVLIEVVQLFEVARSFELGDLVVDALGIAVGSTLYLAGSLLLDRRRNR